MLNDPSQDFLSEIDAFLAETGMGASYFGKAASGNSELVKRLRGNGKRRGRVWPETAEKVRAFMAQYRAAKAEGASMTPANEELA